MVNFKVAFIGPSDISSFENLSIATTKDVISFVRDCCHNIYSEKSPPILTVVPYKGIPVEAAKNYSNIGGEVHGIYDHNLSKSSNFQKNKKFCSKLLKCPENVSIEKYLICYANAIYCMGISFGTMKELIENRDLRRNVYMFEKYISTFPKELLKPLNIKIISNVI